MDTPLKIDEFNTLLKSEQDTNSLVAALSKLTTIENPQDIVDATESPTDSWYGWS